MIVWLASYPRSGNTLLRIAVHRLYGLRASTVYDVDGVAVRLGEDFVGFKERDAAYEALRASDEVNLVKTHGPRGGEVHEDDAALCLVRDGRDALVSWARQRSEDDPSRYEDELRALLAWPRERGAGQWGSNVLSWFEPSADHRVLLRFENLVDAPRETVSAAMARVLPGLIPERDALIPSFAELHAIDDRFFRRGVTGTHRDELPDELHEAFWARPDNEEAMNLLGYRRTLLNGLGSSSPVVVGLSDGM